MEPFKNKLTFQSIKDPTKSIVIGELQNGFYSIVAAEAIPIEENMFSSIEEIEKLLNDQLQLIISKD